MLPRICDVIARTYRSLISFAIVKKACSTLREVLAEVSKKGIFSWSANSYEQTYSDHCVLGALLVQSKNAYLGHAVLDHLLASQIGFVAYKKLVDTLRGITVDFLEPLLDVGEGI